MNRGRKEGVCLDIFQWDYSNYLCQALVGYFLAEVGPTIYHDTKALLQKIQAPVTALDSHHEHYCVLMSQTGVNFGHAVVQEGHPVHL